MNDRIISLLLTAKAAMDTGNVLRVERKPPFGASAEFVDAGIRSRTAPMVITHYKDGSIERAFIAPGSAIACAMNAKSHQQVIAIAKQFQKQSRES